MRVTATSSRPNETKTPVTRRESLRTLASVAAAAAGAPGLLRGRFRLFPDVQHAYSARAVKLVEETVVIDMLNQFRFPDYTDKPPKSERFLNSPGSFTRDEWETYRTSGIRVFALGHAPANYDAAIRFFADWSGFVAAYDDYFVRTDDVGDFERARKAGKIGIMITFQNSDHFRSADDVDTFFGLGQRLSQLTYNFQNRIGCGFLEQNDGGLTVFGATIVERMNKVGMAVDVSHCADETTMDAIVASKKPVAFSHASCRALIPGHGRCKTDEAIKAMAASGGAMGIPMIRFMIRGDEPVTPEHVLDHIDHVAKLVGIEHVGIGSDLDVLGNPNPMNAPAAQSPKNQPNFSRYQYHEDAEGRINIKGLDHPKRVYDLTEGLIARKYSDADIRLVLGGNWSRVMQSIWPA